MLVDESGVGDVGLPHRSSPLDVSADGLSWPSR